MSSSEDCCGTEPEDIVSSIQLQSDCMAEVFPPIWKVRKYILDYSTDPPTERKRLELETGVSEATFRAEITRDDPQVCWMSHLCLKLECALLEGFYARFTYDFFYGTTNLGSVSFPPEDKSPYNLKFSKGSVKFTFNNCHEFTECTSGSPGFNPDNFALNLSVQFYERRGSNYVPIGVPLVSNCCDLTVTGDCQGAGYCLYDQICIEDTPGPGQTQCFIPSTDLNDRFTISEVSSTGSSHGGNWPELATFAFPFPLVAGDFGDEDEINIDYTIGWRDCDPCSLPGDPTRVAKNQTNTAYLIENVSGEACPTSLPNPPTLGCRDSSSSACFTCECQSGIGMTMDVDCYCAPPPSVAPCFCSRGTVIPAGCCVYPAEGFFEYNPSTGQYVAIDELWVSVLFFGRGVVLGTGSNNPQSQEEIVAFWNSLVNPPRTPTEFEAYVMRFFIATLNYRRVQQCSPNDLIGSILGAAATTFDEIGEQVDITNLLDLPNIVLTSAQQELSQQLDDFNTSALTATWLPSCSGPTDTSCAHILFTWSFEGLMPSIVPCTYAVFTINASSMQPNLEIDWALIAQPGSQVLASGTSASDAMGVLPPIQIIIDTALLPFGTNQVCGYISNEGSVIGQDCILRDDIPSCDAPFVPPVAYLYNIYRILPECSNPSITFPSQLESLMEKVLNGGEEGYSLTSDEYLLLASTPTFSFVVTFCPDESCCGPTNVQNLSGITIDGPYAPTSLPTIHVAAVNSHYTIPAFFDCLTAPKLAAPMPSQAGPLRGFIDVFSGLGKKKGGPTRPNIKTQEAPLITQKKIVQIIPKETKKIPTVKKTPQRLTPPPKRVVIASNKAKKILPAPAKVPPRSISTRR